MSARYWCLVSDSLFQAGVTWPGGLRLADPEHLRQHWPPPASPLLPAASWRLIEDDDADPGLDGKRVELILHVRDGVPEIGRRHEVT